jgi:tRNA-splicing ligase RtcB
VPINVYALEGSIEPSALEQIENTASLPFAEGVVLMPDGHFGKGAPIGGVLATSGVVVVNFVGVDIGCSVSSYKTNLLAEKITKEELKTVMGEIRNQVPFGEGNYPEADLELVHYLEQLEKDFKDGKL